MEFSSESLPEPSGYEGDKQSMRCGTKGRGGAHCKCFTQNHSSFKRCPPGQMSRVECESKSGTSFNFSKSGNHSESSGSTVRDLRRWQEIGAMFDKEEEELTCRISFRIAGRVSLRITGRDSPGSQLKPSTYRESSLNL
jgi:hypothetical protein